MKYISAPVVMLFTVTLALSTTSHATLAGRSSSYPYSRSILKACQNNSSFFGNQCSSLNHVVVRIVVQEHVSGDVYKEFLNTSFSFRQTGPDKGMLTLKLPHSHGNCVTTLVKSDGRIDEIYGRLCR